MKVILKLVLAGLAFAQKNLKDCAVESPDVGFQNGWLVSDLDELDRMKTSH